MKKIPTVFVREYKDYKVVNCTNEFTSEETKYAFENGVATIKFDGACCAIINGKFYKRYDAKKGKEPPKGAIPCCEPDKVTGHYPHWVECNRENPCDKWFWEAYDSSYDLEDGTYEAVGKHFNGNPYGLDGDQLIRHGIPYGDEVPREYNKIKLWLETCKDEGVVFWVDGEPVAKIKRTDFGFPWGKGIARRL